ncbi:conjugal transfer protein TrbL family protein [Nonomuraea sp. M3C6]|uniref:Conjugal transfer protein TrbL family protein n=1 Tax=Nonomuraea marmarensis TaxID=3351344 RepID=A0ABW7AEB5_9ACTN
MTSPPAMTATARGLVIAAVATAALGVAAGTACADPAPSPPPELPSLPGMSFGFGDWITKQINSWFATLAASAIKPLLDVLAVTLLATPHVTGSGRVFDLWKATAAIANTAFVLLATIGAITAMGHQTVQTRYAVKEVLPRLAMAILATNTSFLICGKVVETANALSQAILGQDFDAERAAAHLRMLILPPSNSQIFYILLELVAIVLLIMLLISFVMRSALVLLLVVAAPMALACHALPQTDGLARFWWRAFSGLLVIQIAQSLTLVIAVRVFFNQDGRFLLGIAPTGQLVNLVLALCLLIILVRIPGWISRRIFAQAGGSRSTIVRIFKYALAYKLTSPVLNALHLGRGRRGGKPAAAAKGAVASTLVGKVLPAVAGGPAGTAAATAVTAATAAGRGTRAVGSSGVVAQGGAARATASGPQPRWQSAKRRWMPPDPHAPIAWGTSATPQAYQRWSNPAQRWTPPGPSAAPKAGIPARPVPSTSRAMATPLPPAAPTAWVPPDTKPAPPARGGGSASGRGRRPRRRGGEQR